MENEFGVVTAGSCELDDDAREELSEFDDEFVVPRIGTVMELDAVAGEKKADNGTRDAVELSDSDNFEDDGTEYTA